MAVIKSKAYHRELDGSVTLVDVANLNSGTPGDGASKLAIGDVTPESIRLVTPGSPITTETLFKLAADLVSNDTTINNERGALNEIISEGVLEIPLQTFNYTLNAPTISQDLYTIDIGPGKLKINDIDAGGVFVFNGISGIEIPEVETLGWYRRDLIRIVYKNSFASSETVPYIEYVTGKEEEKSTKVYTVEDKIYKNGPEGFQSDSFSAYPLWSVLVYKTPEGLPSININTIYQVFCWAGFKKTIQQLDAPAFKYNSGALGLYRINKIANIPLTNPNGNILSPLYGQDKIATDLNSVSFIPTDNYPEEVPVTAARIEQSSNFNFPYKFDAENYTRADSFELRNVQLGLNVDYNHLDHTEGLQISVYDVEQYLFENGLTVANIDTSVQDNILVNVKVSGDYGFYNEDYPTPSFIGDMDPRNKVTRIVIDKDLSTAITLTRDFVTMIDAATGPQALDFILIVDGAGQYQVSPIYKIDTDDNDLRTIIYVRNFNVPINTTSKIGFFKGRSEQLSGSNIFDSDKQKEKPVDYNDYTNQCPITTHTGISQVPWTWPTQQTILIDGIETLVDIEDLTNNLDLSTRFTNIAVQAGLVAGGDITKSLTGWRIPSDAQYAADPLANGNPPIFNLVNMPFKLKLKFNKWYFFKVTVLQKTISNPVYSNNPKVLIENPDGVAPNGLNGYYATKYRITNGQYPYIDDTTDTIIFQIKDAYGPIEEDVKIPIIDNDGNITGYSNDSIRLDDGLPAKYRIFAKNLNAENFIVPDILEEPDVCYVDTLNGIFSFNPEMSPNNVTVTCWYNNILSGGFTSENIIHHEIAEVDGTNAILTVSEKLQNLNNKISDILILPNNVNTLALEAGKNGLSPSDITINTDKTVSILADATWIII